MNTISDHLSSWGQHPLIESVGWVLVHSLWQGAIIGVVVLGILSMLRTDKPNARYCIACLGLLSIALCPIGTLLWQNTQATEARSSTIQPSVAIAVEHSTKTPSIPSTADKPSNPITTEPELSHNTPPSITFKNDQRSEVSREAKLPDWLLPSGVVLWLAGVILLSTRLFIGWIWIQRLRSLHLQPTHERVQASMLRLSQAMGISQKVKMVESTLVDVPTVIGWFKPIILLPASALTGLAPQQIEALLAHELAHIRRHDYAINLIQTAIETTLFYHPAVWWLSRTIRTEREVCCDSIATHLCGDPLEYANALAAMEELRGYQTQLVLGAGGISLMDRIRRVLGLPVATINRSAWWLIAAVAAGVCVAYSMNLSDPALAQAPNTTDQTSENWGPANNGIQCRVMAVAPQTDDEQPNFERPTDRFDGALNATFAVELKNVSDEVKTLLGVRYGDSYPTAVNKLNTEFFAPYLFDLTFKDSAGKPIARPKRESLGGMIEVSGASAQDLEPGQSLIVLLRPAKFAKPSDYQLLPGDYQLQITYRGPSATSLAGLKKHWPDSPQSRAWNGAAESQPIRFRINPDPKADPRPDLAWGPEKHGLQAAAELLPTSKAEDPEAYRQGIPLNSTLRVTYYIKNVSQNPISFVSETWRQEDSAFCTRPDGTQVDLVGTWYSGMPIMVRWTLQPGEIAELQAANLGVAEDAKAQEKFEHPIGKTLIGGPGTYKLTYSLRMGSIQQRNERDEVTIPGPEDVTGELKTGTLELKVRARTPEDDMRDRADYFVGKIQFVSPDGKPISSGILNVRGNAAQSSSPNMEIQEGATNVPDLNSKPATVYVRANGYEETIKYDVSFQPDQVQRIELKPASPTSGRIVSSVNGKPVEGATVRYFNKTSAVTGSFPYPMDGLKGPIWATTDSEGRFVLDSLQKTDPYYANWGDAIYFFYIEAPGMAGRFLPQVRAGKDLGEIKLSPPLEVSGEIIGTEEELKNFAAEWDQPFELTNDVPEAAFQYATSAPLETKREGNKLKFKLSGLGLGKLRIIANFDSSPHSVSHTYSRRDPKGTDQLIELDLDHSLDNVILQRKKP